MCLMGEWPIKYLDLPLGWSPFNEMLGSGDRKGVQEA